MHVKTCGVFFFLYLNLPVSFWLSTICGCSLVSLTLFWSTNNLLIFPHFWSTACSCISAYFLHASRAWANSAPEVFCYTHLWILFFFPPESFEKYFCFHAWSSSFFFREKLKGPVTYTCTTSIYLHGLCLVCN